MGAAIAMPGGPAPACPTTPPGTPSHCTGTFDRTQPSIEFRLDPDSGVLNLEHPHATGPSTLDFTLTRETNQGTELFTHNGVLLTGPDMAALEYGSWPGASRDMDLVTTHDGQQSTATLTNDTRRSGVSGFEPWRTRPGVIVRDFRPWTDARQRPTLPFVTHV